MRPLALALLLATAARADGPHAREFARHQGDADAPWTVSRWPMGQAATRPQLAYRVYGYLPYWQSIDSSFRWDLISDLVIFAAVLNTDGTVAAWHGWPNASLISTAHAHGVRVHLCAMLFSGIGKLLNSAAPRTQAAQALAHAIGSAGGDGLNFDLEFVAAGDRDAYSAFLEQAKVELEKSAPGAELSIASPPSVGYRGYDFARIAKSARLLVMNYDYHWQSAPTTGPVSPLAGASTWGEVIEGDMAALLKLAPADSIVMGVPYYGYDWPASSADPKASTLAHGSAVLFKNAVVAAPGYGALWDAASETPWYRYVNPAGTNHQVWFDDAQSIALKYRFLKSQRLAGAMIWALGYDNGRTELWQAIHDELGEVIWPDAGTPDGGSSDGGSYDGGSHDGGSHDGGSNDAGSDDAGSYDAGSHDAGSADGGAPDAGAIDAGGEKADGGLTPQTFTTNGCSTSSGSIAMLLGLVALLARRRSRAV